MMSRSRLLAKAWALGRVWQAVHDLSSGYVSEKRRGGGMRTTAARKAS
jgi:predicted metallopeptidase